MMGDYKQNTARRKENVTGDFSVQLPGCTYGTVSITGTAADC